MHNDKLERIHPRGLGQGGEGIDCAFFFHVSRYTDIIACSQLILLINESKLALVAACGRCTARATTAGGSNLRRTMSRLADRRTSNQVQHKPFSLKDQRARVEYLHGHIWQPYF